MSEDFLAPPSHPETDSIGSTRRGDPGQLQYIIVPWERASGASRQEVSRAVERFPGRVGEDGLAYLEQLGMRWPDVDDVYSP